MIIYRYDGRKSRLVPHRHARWADFYAEADLEQWLERNPTFITGGVPLLIIARQPRIGNRCIPDLIGVDKVGSTVVVELKQGQPSRESVAQVTEYAAQVATLEDSTIREMANQYLSQQQPPQTLARAWRTTFGEPFPQDRCLNRHQSVVLIVEGQDKRTAQIVRYMRSQGVDISLLAYHLYIAEEGEILLSRRLQVGEEEIPVVRKGTIESPSAPVYTVEGIRQEHPRAYERWTEVEEEQLAQSYHAGKEIEELARLHQRQPSAIRARLHQRGLLESWSKTGQD